MTKLENGLELLVIEDNSVPLATVEICVHNGSYTEDPDYNGLSHLYEHMFLRLTKIFRHRNNFLPELMNWELLLMELLPMKE
ncbi:MAG: insulinase family protein [Bacteroidetes bacterium]|nr:insulinase family protein [Bacteroidota bacterium]